MGNELTQFCDSFLDMGLPGFDLVVYRAGECLLRHMGGFSDWENKIPVNGSERYNLYSCSKPITCAAALQLWEQGLFSLEDKLSDYMPEFDCMAVHTPVGLRKAHNPILIRHLFEMTAGFGYDTGAPFVKAVSDNTNGRCPTRETMRYLAQAPLLFEPGARWEYSFCHDVLAALVEVISGLRFSKYVKKNIFDPLGMTQSTYCLPETELDTVACQYIYSADTGELRNCGKRIQLYKLGSEYESGGAGAVSTVGDMVRFLEALRTGNSILKKETVRLMSMDRLSNAQQATFMLKDTHGYGLGVRVPKKGSALREFGWGGYAGSYPSVDIENQLTIFYAQHTITSPNRAIRNQIYWYAMAEYCGKEEFKELIKNSPCSQNAI